MPYEEQRVFSASAKTFAHIHPQAISAWYLAGVGLLVFVLILPFWLIRYVPLYDYQNHLLEAQVLVRYEEPQMGYSSFYEIREGWYLRSNALTTIMMAGMGQVIPMEFAGKVVLSLYAAVLGFGMAALLRFTGSSLWLALFLPVLIYNFTFTAGMLNWSFGFALTPWAVLAFLKWQQRKSGSSWTALAILLLLIYVAHILAWMLVLIVLFALAALNGVDKWGRVKLLIVSFSAVPLLLLTRPMLAVVPISIFVIMWALMNVINRFNISALGATSLGVAGTVAFLVGMKMLQPQIQEFFPDVGYSSYSKTVSLFQTFSLPHFYGADDTWLIPLNLLSTGLILLSIAVLAVESWKAYRRKETKRGKWLGVFFLMLIGYFVVPTRTYDIIVTEPRLLVFAFFFGLLAVKFPLNDYKWVRLVIPLLGITAVVPIFSIWYYSFRYDEAAQNWASQLQQIPPRQRLLVLSNPLPEDVKNPLAIGQIFDQHQFANTYTLEKGGFTSNTFFNGPLLPLNPASIPPYWWIEFKPGPYIDRVCERLKPEYDVIMLWNPRSQGILESLNGCYGEPESQFSDMWVWKSSVE